MGGKSKNRTSTDIFDAAVARMGCRPYSRFISISRRYCCMASELLASSFSITLLFFREASIVYSVWVVQQPRSDGEGAAHTNKQAPQEQRCQHLAKGQKREKKTAHRDAVGMQMSRERNSCIVA